MYYGGELKRFLKNLFLLLSFFGQNIFVKFGFSACTFCVLLTPVLPRPLKNRMSLNGFEFGLWHFRSFGWRVNGLLSS